MAAEKILCFPRSILEYYASNNERIFFERKLLEKIYENLLSIPRVDAEKDPSLKQLVTYIVARCKGLYLSYRRTPKTEEKKLAGMDSIGIGGHVNYDDRQAKSLFRENYLELFYEAANREKQEEIYVEPATKQSLSLDCFINDDSNAVGIHHFGLVFVLELDTQNVRLKGERGLGQIRFSAIDKLLENLADFEPWSVLLLQYLQAKENE